MSVDFHIKDFMYPLSILKLRHFLERSQWFSEDTLRQYQLKRLKLILWHAYKHVPYYRELFDRENLTPGDVRDLEDLSKVPLPVMLL